MLNELKMTRRDYVLLWKSFKCDKDKMRSLLVPDKYLRKGRNLLLVVRKALKFKNETLRKQAITV